jgi:O-succinylbenzoate synthase
VVLKPSLVHLPGLASLLATAGFPVKRLVFSAAFESGVGISVLAQYAAAFGTPGVAAGLDTYRLLSEDVLETPLPLAPGHINLDALAAAAQNVCQARLTAVE